MPPLGHINERWGSPVKIIILINHGFVNKNKAFRKNILIIFLPRDSVPKKVISLPRPHIL